MVLCLPAGGTATDPDPGETAKRDVELATAWDGTPAAVVGVGDGGWKAVELAAANGGSSNGSPSSRRHLSTTPSHGW